MKIRDIIISHFTQRVIKGLFGVLPAALVIVILFWIYNTIQSFVNLYVFTPIGFTPGDNKPFWIAIAVIIFILILYIFGFLIETRLAMLFGRLVAKIPGYQTVKDMIGIFNSSKKGDTKVLVVAISGFGNNDSYNIGLMYSQKESIIKDHYTVSLSLSPVPSGGFMFEVHKKDIYIIEEASFDSHLQYLLSMGVKNLAEISKTEPKPIDSLLPFEKWLETKKNNANSTIQ
ncbi:MAG: DUF502 domain-containing protein [Sulfurovaceae bacterium]|nr:DUF502 domain-containing protein [Sulfurovaceae bacterium]